MDGNGIGLLWLVGNALVLWAHTVRPYGCGGSGGLPTAGGRVSAPTGAADGVSFDIWR